MAISIEVCTIAGVVRGVARGAGSVRELLESGGLLEVERASFAAVDRITDPKPQGAVHLDTDEVLVALDPAGMSPVHAHWHPIRVTVGPWVVEGELPTLPGYDPGRSIARPSGSFVPLRDARVSRASDGEPASDHHVALVHRYAVEHVEADLELGFYFPGASVAVAAGLSRPAYG